MKTFLEYVAIDLIDRFGTDLSKVAVVFPNKRASLFLNEYIAQYAGKPVWSPAYITISDLFRSQSQLVVADPIKLVCDLYKTYVEVTKSDESLDHFYGWGQVMLADFDDIDKNMAEADKVFCNMRDLHELDDVSYLTPEQVELIRKFFSNFNADKTTELKERFLKIWCRFGDIYRDFNERLASQGLAYEGALYRQVAQSPQLTLGHEHYVFVGFNLLQRVEQTLFSRLNKEGKALFYWDFDDYYMKNEAGHYIASYLTYFPNALDSSADEIYKNMRRTKHIEYISATTEDIQARYVSKWLKEGDRINDGRKTAVVMCNEGLLQSVVHALPDEVEHINVTTGYPLGQTPLASLIDDTIRQHPHTEDIMQLLQWALAMVKLMAQGQKGGKDQMMQEALFRTYTIVNRLIGLVEAKDLTCDCNTLRRLYAEIVRTTNIPFHGEPIIGTQIMGVLETRNLDFSHLLLLSCNEGNMPKGVNDTSFIPYSVRKAHGLTTIDNKVAIYSYYFYRLMQRAEDITIIYNKAADGLSTGEMSRFMLQMLVESGHDIERKTMVMPNNTTRIEVKDTVKNAQVMHLLKQRFDKAHHPTTSSPLMTPTAISAYMKCPMLFYYRYVAAIQTPDIIDEVGVDARTFGNIFHDSVQQIYERIVSAYGPDIKKDTLQRMYKAESFIRGVVESMFKPVNGIQLINESVIITYIKQLIKTDIALAPFTIKALESIVEKEVEIESAGGHFLTTLGGRIDRMDCVTDADGNRRIRVIDFKTGNNMSRNDGYIMQVMLYSILTDQNPQFNPEHLPVSPALLYIQHAAGDNFDPTIKIGKDKVTDVSGYAEEYMGKIMEVMEEIFNPNVPFTHTEDEHNCQYCHFKALCGRF